MNGSAAHENGIVSQPSTSHDTKAALTYQNGATNGFAKNTAAHHNGVNGHAKGVNIHHHGAFKHRTSKEREGGQNADAEVHGAVWDMLSKVSLAVRRRWERACVSPSVSSNSTETTDPSSLEEGYKGQRRDTMHIFTTLTPLPLYQQSSTRRLAFGTESESEYQSKPLDDFYNNSTLVTISKVFCAIVLLIAFVLVMSRSFDVDLMSYIDHF